MLLIGFLTAIIWPIFRSVLWCAQNKTLAKVSNLIIAELSCIAAPCSSNNIVDMEGEAERLGVTQVQFECPALDKT